MLHIVVNTIAKNVHNVLFMCSHSWVMAEAIHLNTLNITLNVIIFIKLQLIVKKKKKSSKLLDIKPTHLLSMAKQNSQCNFPTFRLDLSKYLLVHHCLIQHKLSLSFIQQYFQPWGIATTLATQKQHNTRSYC